MDTFIAELQVSDLLKSPPDNLDGLVTLFNDTLSSLVDKHAPLKTQSMARPLQPWFNDKIKEAKLLRRSLERTYRKSNTPSDLLAFNRQKNLVNHTIEKAKGKHLSQLVKDNESSQRALFKITKSLFGQNKASPLPPHDSIKELADNFGTFFVTKIKTIMDYLDNLDLPASSMVEEKGSISNPLTDFTPVTEDKVKEYIMKSSTKSYDLDAIPTKLLRKCTDVLLPVITQIINLSLRLGKFPDAWKEAIIIPLLKKLGLDLILKNFRPVSNLIFISKICERIVADQFHDHCSVNSLFTLLQSAYKEGHSTETTLVKVQNDLLRAMDNDEVVLLLLLDLSAVFDTVSHDIMLSRLEHRFGISGTALKWFESYLRGRKQSVLIQGTRSDLQELEWGVPQGSVLGPLLFTCYTSPLADLAEKHKIGVHMYADDTQSYISFKPIVQGAEGLAVNNMSTFITDLRCWMCENKLKLNDDKTMFLLVGRPAQISKVTLDSFQMGNVTIPKSDIAPNLGCLWDSELNLKSHVNQICKSSFYYLRNIYRVRKYLNKSQTETVVHAFISSRLDYCNSLLVGLPDYVLNDLQLVQNASARVVVGLRKYDHITSTRIALHWLPVKQRIEYKVLLLTFKSLNGKGPAYLADMFIRYGADYSLRSMSKDVFAVPKTNKKCCGDRAFSVVAPKLWNKLPSNVKCAKDVNVFKTALKTHLFRVAYNV